MKLAHCTWYEVADYLSSKRGILLPCGSTEQHGPMGLIGTDAICATEIAGRVANVTNSLVAPELAYTPAPFNTGFPGTISVSAGLFENLAREILTGLHAQGFERIYVLNGHGANLEPLRTAMAGLPEGTVRLRSWWDFNAVNARRQEFYGSWEGMHATPAEVAITQATTRETRHTDADAPPARLSADYIAAHAGDKHGPPAEHRASFPDGRVGSHSALATPEHGRALLAAATKAIADDFSAFTATI
ncbi:Creatinine amidohydrolase [Candidatus Rhodobacter oscarellae]|uniref:Creatinine amidohydrolase n=1 Tax=Candidatus Rhodobacter oscarellae TaxID=1675527 RepID=A0A0J9E3X8_9RHOB|nr:creatininase family protein [Candidatus Rhodobacter lobularis]KMW57495.1 Creatinine amidohydrolase [Candidatus Rhodobacter lobularis]